MTFGGSDSTGPRGRDIALLLLSAAGLAMCITLLFFGMRAVMDIGGACADGGPFLPVQPCPEGVPVLMMLGMFGLFLFGGLGFYAGSKVGGGWAALPLLAWPGLFLSLGWNFLEYGFWPPGGGGWEWGWLIPGFIFLIMGGAPLVFAWGARREFGGPDGGSRVASTFGLPASGGQSVKVSYGWHPENRASAVAATSVVSATSATSATGGDPTAVDGDLVDRLERLAALRRSGDLTTEEYETAKAALLGDRSAEAGA
jgi:hypothetical protein